MYLNDMILKSFRTFSEAEIEFSHPEQDFAGICARLGIEQRRPRLRNVNLILGNNGSGKTTLLKAIALAALGPSVGDSGLFPYRLVRRKPWTRSQTSTSGEAEVSATFRLHDQDTGGEPPPLMGLLSSVIVSRKGDLERLRWGRDDEKGWQGIFSSESEAFFFVGYGATRRVESRERVDLGTRSKTSFGRARRVMSLFEESYSLLPLSLWLPRLETDNPGRYKQVVNLINRLLGIGHYTFRGKMDQGEYLFEKGGTKVPFGALSDGYRAYLGWIGDLLYHVCETTPSGKKLVDNKGIVMVDEIDLHLHPKWQMNVLPNLARRLPNIQFIVTSHSPLVVGSLEWLNIIMMAPGAMQTSKPKRVLQAVHGLDADQVLLTHFFGLESTRVHGKKRQLKELSLRAGTGDTEAAKQLLTQMTKGMEETQDGPEDVK